MQKILFRLFIFILPIVVFLSIPLVILWQTKENFYSIDKLIDSNEKYLIGYTYTESNYHYLKWHYLLSHEKKCVWSLGSSRVLQFRGKMFDSTFYNAGYTVLDITDFGKFLKTIPDDKYPKYLIIGLDQWMFNPAWITANPEVTPWDHTFTSNPKFPETYKNVYTDLFARNLSLKSLKKNDSIVRIGINATQHNSGFRNDGSMYYGAQIPMLMNNNPKASDYQFANTFSRIENGSQRFEYGAHISEPSILELNKLLAYCSAHQIKVVAFLPPLADTVYNKMVSSGKYGYLKEIYPKLKPVFDKYSYELYDFSNTTLCHSNDKESFDGFHGSEVTYQRLLISMLGAGSALNNVSNAERLKTDLSNRKNNYTVYDY